MREEFESSMLVDHQGLQVRLTIERRMHILEHPEMVNQFERLMATIQEPELIVRTNVDPSVHVYHRFYQTTPVTSKFMLVAVKIEADDAFVLTAFYSSRQKKGTVVWQR